MNNKMAKIHIYQQLNLKNNLSKQEEQRQNHGYGEPFHSCQLGGGWERMGEEVKGLRSTNKPLQNSHGYVKCRIGNGVVAKELICMTHGHEQ